MTEYYTITEDNHKVRVDRAIRCIVSVNNGNLEFGYFNRYSIPAERISRVRVRGFNSLNEKNALFRQRTFDYYIIDLEKYAEYFIFDADDGSYTFIPSMTKYEQLCISKRRPQGAFPYTFRQHHEAIHISDVFDKMQVVENKRHYSLSEFMPYTFGLEFETSMGVIKQEDCLKSGLIPLRDGSISGIEYTTVVLKSDDGLSLLEQGMKLLKENTFFNKDCSVHVHMGGLDVTPVAIWTSYLLYLSILNEMRELLPIYAFDTTKYKTEKNKNYCEELPAFHSFKEMYAYLTDTAYMGSLTQCHPNDVDRHAKWHVKTRYHNLNYINMVCYDGPKTLEFRFLKPTYNFRVIYLWLWIFNAIISASNKICKDIKCVNIDKLDTSYLSDVANINIDSLYSLLRYVYGEELASKVWDEVLTLKFANDMQQRNGDYCGNDAYIMDYVFDEPSPLINVSDEQKDSKC